MAGTPRIQHVCVTTADCLESGAFAGSIHGSPDTGRDEFIAITESPGSCTTTIMGQPGILCGLQRAGTTVLVVIRDLMSAEFAHLTFRRADRRMAGL